MSMLKTLGAVGVMIACFAIIYPRFMHPIVLRTFGISEPPRKTEDDTLFPPNYNQMHPEARKQEDIRKYIKPGPHPGMRAAAEMQRQQAQQQGSGRGMMGVVLPMYAIGIVLYLVYTLFKVFNKSKNNSWSKIGGQYEESDNSVDRMGFPMDFDGSTDLRSYLQDQQHRKELEDLLSRVDDKNVSTEEMRLLQKRLEETEAQMTRILQAMQSVQNNVNQMTGTFPPSQDEGNHCVEKDIINAEEDIKDDKGEHSINDADKERNEEEDNKVNDLDFDGIDKDDEEVASNEVGDKQTNCDSQVRRRNLNTMNEQ